MYHPHVGETQREQLQEFLSHANAISASENISKVDGGGGRLIYIMLTGTYHLCTGVLID